MVVNSHNMKNLFLINEEEKNRILNLHETATKRHYLSEQPYLDMYQPVQPGVVGPQGPQTLLDAGAIVKQGDYGDPYIYAKLGNDYYVAKVSDGDNPNWRLVKTEKSIRVIKSKIFNQEIPVNKTIIPPKKEDDKKKTIIPKKEDDKKKTIIPKKEGGRQSNINKVYCSVKNGLITIGTYKNIKWVDYVKQWNILPTEIAISKKSCPKKEENKNKVEINPELKKLGFTIDYDSFNKDVGYFVTKCKQKQCSEFTGDMLNKTFGDAWHAKENLGVKVNVDTNTVKKMETLFNKMNNSGIIPSLEQKTPFDNEAKEIVKKLIPDQSKFQNLPIGTVVGLYFPPSSNYDLAFFQGAIGKTRTGKGELKSIISHPYFCKNLNDCKDTVWTEKDLGRKNKFVAGNTLKSGESFAPVTHLGFIGYKDKNGVPYIVHNIKHDVYAFPTNKLNPDGLQIIWAAQS